MIEGLFQPLHLILILAIIMIVFGAGKLPEMGGAIGRGIKEFRSEVHDATEPIPTPVEPPSIKVKTEAQQASVAAFCSNCGERVPNSAKFCPSCGTGVAPAQPEVVDAISVETETVPEQSQVPTA